MTAAAGARGLSVTATQAATGWAAVSARRAEAPDARARSAPQSTGRPVGKEQACARRSAVIGHDAAGRDAAGREVPSTLRRTRRGTGGNRRACLTAGTIRAVPFGRLLSSPGSSRHASSLLCGRLRANAATRTAGETARGATAQAPGGGAARRGGGAFESARAPAPCKGGGRIDAERRREEVLQNSSDFRNVNITHKSPSRSGATPRNRPALPAGVRVLYNRVKAINLSTWSW